LKTPILERFHQRKVTVPRAFSMREGVKKGNKILLAFFKSEVIKILLPFSKREASKKV
jgi:hypothetical protein